MGLALPVTGSAPILHQRNVAQLTAAHAAGTAAIAAVRAHDTPSRIQVATPAANTAPETSVHQS